MRRERDSATVPWAKEDDGPDALEHAVIPVSGMTGGDCADKIETALRTAGETVAVELLPEKPGEYSFACQMGMLRGKLIVT